MLNVPRAANFWSADQLSRTHLGWGIIAPVRGQVKKSIYWRTLSLYKDVLRSSYRAHVTYASKQAILVTV